MRAGILELRLETGALAAQREFYTRGLELLLAEEAADRFTVRAGATRLTFVQAAQDEPTYHFAFDVPENRLAQAEEWLSRRTPVLAKDGQETFHFPDWNAHGFYFHDPAGNLVEFIARHDLDNASPRPFAAGEILHASEIGLVVDDVAAQVKALERALGLTLYRPASAEFAPVGDEHRLLIVNHRGRGWWPDTPSRPYPLLASLSGEPRREYRAADYPFTVLLQGPA